MLLAVAATQMEMEPFLELTHDERGEHLHLITGVGPMETAVTLGRFLAEYRSQVTALIQFGVAGAYIDPNANEQLPLLSVCFAEREVMGDLGVAFSDKVEYLPEELVGELSFSLQSTFLEKGLKMLREKGVLYTLGTFVTVNSTSGTQRRGDMLCNRWQGLCENMEGAAVARLCQEYKLPLMEMRVISNLVEDRNVENWQLKNACAKSAEVAALLVKELR